MQDNVYIVETGIESVVVESKSQLVELTGCSIRSIHNKLDKGVFSGFKGSVWYKVTEAPFIRDKRVKNKGNLK